MQTCSTPTRRSVAVLAHMPNATVLTSHLIASMISNMATVAYGEPPETGSVALLLELLTAEAFL